MELTVLNKSHRERFVQGGYNINFRLRENFYCGRIYIDGMKS